jgi:hypothetical protein
MIDVNDLTEIVWPVCPTMCGIFGRLAGRRFATGQHGCNRCEEIPPVKAGREALGFPVNVSGAGACGTALNQFEQTVPGAEIPTAVRFDNNRGARAAYTGIVATNHSAYAANK